MKFIFYFFLYFITLFNFIIFILQYLLFKIIKNIKIYDKIFLNSLLIYFEIKKLKKINFLNIFNYYNFNTLNIIFFLTYTKIYKFIKLKIKEEINKKSLILFFHYGLLIPYKEFGKLNNKKTLITGFFPFSYNSKDFFNPILKLIIKVNNNDKYFLKLNNLLKKYNVELLSLDNQKNIIKIIKYLEKDEFNIIFLIDILKNKNFFKFKIFNKEIHFTNSFLKIKKLTNCDIYYGLINSSKFFYFKNELLIDYLINEDLKILKDFYLSYLNKNIFLWSNLHYLLNIKKTNFNNIKKLLISKNYYKIIYFNKIFLINRKNYNIIFY